jgi:thiamine-phosphate pyrophosphorylase
LILLSGAIISGFPKAYALSDIAGAARAGVDYVKLSPIFVTVRKPGFGLALASARSRVRRSKGSGMMALGRVTAGTARACLDAGATGIAVIGETMRFAIRARAPQILEAMQP